VKKSTFWRPSLEPSNQVVVHTRPWSRQSGHRTRPPTGRVNRPGQVYIWSECFPNHCQTSTLRTRTEMVFETLIISVGFWRWCVSIERIVLLDFIHHILSSLHLFLDQLSLLASKRVSLFSFMVFTLSPKKLTSSAQTHCWCVPFNSKPT
jgi:hypothetical protein